MPEWPEGLPVDVEWSPGAAGTLLVCARDGAALAKLDTAEGGSP